MATRWELKNENRFDFSLSSVLCDDGRMNCSKVFAGFLRRKRREIFIATFLHLPSAPPTVIRSTSVAPSQTHSHILHNNSMNKLFTQLSSELSRWGWCMADEHFRDPAEMCGKQQFSWQLVVASRTSSSCRQRVWCWVRQRKSCQKTSDNRTTTTVEWIVDKSHNFEAEECTASYHVQEPSSGHCEVEVAITAVMIGKPKWTLRIGILFVLARSATTYPSHIRELDIENEKELRTRNLWLIDRNSVFHSSHKVFSQLFSLLFFPPLRSDDAQSGKWESGRWKEAQKRED